MQRKAELFEDFKVIEQLRCGGVIEAVRMCRESYPSRFPHEEFIASFSSICPEVIQILNFHVCYTAATVYLVILYC